MLGSFMKEGRMKSRDNTAKSRTPGLQGGSLQKQVFMVADWLLEACVLRTSPLRLCTGHTASSFRYSGQGLLAFSLLSSHLGEQRRERKGGVLL